jgi:DNA-binding transcriptional regulator LsrR (DeoR family)
MAPTKQATGMPRNQAADPTDEGGGRRSARLRQRAAWMYYVEDMTQGDIADRLGITRITVVRLLAEARRSNEVKIWIEGTDAGCVELERRLEEAFGLEEAIVVPVSGDQAAIATSIGAATGRYVSEQLHDDMSIGVGWGETLMGALRTISARRTMNLQVISMLGGITKAKRFNPSEFAWQFANHFDADCFLIAAPAFVDSAETKRILIERCGLNDVYRRAERLDMAVVSVGGTAADATTFRFGFFSEQDRSELLRLGAVGDVLYNFFDVDGNLVKHPINDRIMSIPIPVIRRIPRKVMCSGGLAKIEAILGAMRLLEPNVLITDEITATEILARRG